jgi:hypothetical protein
MKAYVIDLTKEEDKEIQKLASAKNMNIESCLKDLVKLGLSLEAKTGDEELLKKWLKIVEAQKTKENIQ